MQGSLHSELVVPKMEVSFGDVHTKPFLGRCIHLLFEEQAAKTPDKIAVVFGDQRLSYGELNRQANQLAHHLGLRGVKPGVLVAVSLDRSLEVLVAIFAILKAGGAYIPLDPGYPPDRLACMIEQARASVLIQLGPSAAKFTTPPGVEVVWMDADWPAIARESSENPPPRATPDDLIYVIFTSGSTGQPKGAAIRHGGFSNLLHWFVSEFEIADADHTLLCSSISFDLTQKNLYAPLIRGGTLYLCPPGPYDLTLLARLIEDHGITLINCTPSAFYPLVETNDASAFQRLSSLRLVFLGGEIISISRLRNWLNDPACRAEIANTYGPTECTDICGFYRLNRANLDRYSFVPLGRPIQNVQLVVVDEYLNQCPVGAPGELCIGGAGVGAGYINDPAMTAEKFIANPFPEISSPLIYRSGDQVRMLPEGVIEFLGRLDHQVKIRGFRIELHEIEKALNTHPSVTGAVVMASDSDDANSRLVSFFTTKNNVVVGAEELKHFLKERLPDYMLPAIFQRLETFPLSPNGKVDRRALRDLPRPDHPATPALPANELEQQILRVWCEILPDAQIGLNDNFFDLGGDSIRLAQVHARLQPLVGRAFPITDLFAHTTVHAIADHFGSEKSKAGPDKTLQDRARNQRQAFKNYRTARP